MPFLAPSYRRIVAPSGIIRTGLQSRWPMNEGSGTVVGDDQGTNDGTMVNMSEAAWVAGIGIGPNAGPYSIDFRTEYSAPNITCGPLTPANQTAVSICARILPSSVVQCAIIDNGSVSNARIFRLSILSATAVHVLLGDSGGGWGLVWQAGISVPADVMSHLGFTWDGATARAYLNGTEMDTEPYADSLIAVGIDPCNIGNLSSPSNAWAFEGILDDVRVYSRALDPAEMLSISNGTG